MCDAFRVQGDGGLPEGALGPYGYPGVALGGCEGSALGGAAPIGAPACGSGGMPGERVLSRGGGADEGDERKALGSRPPAIQLPGAVVTPELESPNGPLELCQREAGAEVLLAGLGGGLVVEKPAWDMDTLKRAVAGAKTGAGEVARVVETCTFKPREQAFTALINMCGQARDWRKAVEVFEAMKAVKGVRPNTYTYSSLIAACSNAGEWQRALEFFEVMKAAAAADPNCEPNEVTYSALITACERGGVFAKALEVYDTMLAAGIPGDHISFSSALSACEKSGNMVRAKEILQEMHNRGFVASLGIYKEIMLDYAENEDWNRALDMCLTMQMMGQDPNEGGRKRRGKKKPAPAPQQTSPYPPSRDSASCGEGPSERDDPGVKSPAAKPAWDMETLKRAIVLAKLGSGEVHRVIESCQFKPREQAFTALINLCGRLRDWKKAVEVFEAMKTVRGVRPNTYTYSALIAACSSAGEWEKALEIFEAMKQAAKSDCNCRPNEVTYSALITACQRGGMFDKALELYDETIRACVSTDQITFSSALAACEKSERWDKAERILEDMHARGLTGSPSVYCELIHNHAENRKWNSALDVFVAMQLAGAEPDTNTCKALMKALDRGAQPEMVLELYNSMRESGIGIDMDIYNMAVKATVQVEGRRANGSMLPCPGQFFQMGMGYGPQPHLMARRPGLMGAPKPQGLLHGMSVPQFESRRSGAPGYHHPRGESSHGQPPLGVGVAHPQLQVQQCLGLVQHEYNRNGYVSRMGNMSLNGP